MPRPRTRVDDEEALIPRSDMEEFHTTTRKKSKRSCSFCGLKCWFGMFLLLILASTALFYFVYPSVVHENFNKLMGFACGASGYAAAPNSTIACLVMTSHQAIESQAAAVDKTWGKLCTTRYYFYEGNPSEHTKSTLARSYVVSNITSLEPLSIAFNKSDASSWFLQANDDMYVVYQRLQSLLVTKESSTPVYIGDKITSAHMGAFVLNNDAAAILMNRTTYVKTDSLSNSIMKRLNVQESSGFTVDNPLSTTLDAAKMETMSHASVFRQISAQQMFILHVFNNA